MKDVGIFWGCKEKEGFFGVAKKKRDFFRL